MKLKKARIPFRIQIANKRFALWKDPETRVHMELIRQRATIRAKEVKDNKTLVLKTIFQQSPKEFTALELKDFIQSKISLPKRKDQPTRYDSFIYRLRRKGIIKYDAGLGKWVNLTHTTTLPDAEQTNDSNLQN